MFVEFLPLIGTKNYRYDAFNTKLLSCTSGIDCSIDKYSKSTDMNDLMDRNENILLSTGFLD
jgi:hypothetical protein